MDVEVQLPQLFPTMLGVIVTIYPFFLGSHDPVPCDWKGNSPPELYGNETQ
jgi:hypothetical protein